MNSGDLLVVSSVDFGASITDSIYVIIPKAWSCWKKKTQNQNIQINEYNTLVCN